MFKKVQNPVMRFPGGKVESGARHFGGKGPRRAVGGNGGVHNHALLGGGGPVKSPLERAS
jgi:hypothetical protein